jgi:hypothetical protein
MPDESASDHDLLIRIEAKLDAWRDTQTDHEGRLRRLEKLVWIGAGLAMAGGAGLSKLAELIN